MSPLRVAPAPTIRALALLVCVAAVLAVAAPSLAHGARVGDYRWHPKLLFHLPGGAVDVAFDGARVAVLTPAPARVDVRTLSGGLVAHAGLRVSNPAELALLAFGGTRAVVNQTTNVGNSEIDGRWLLAEPGAASRVIRSYGTTHEGAGTIICCPIVNGSGVAAQGSQVAYAIAGALYRVAGARSIRIASGVAHVWALNARRILVQRSDGRLALVDPAGRALRVLAAPSSPASTVKGAALQGNRGVVLRLLHQAGGATELLVDVYELGTGSLTATWPLGPNADAGTPPTLYGRIAAFEGVGTHPAQLLDVVSGKHTSTPIAGAIGRIRLRGTGLVYAGGSFQRGLFVRVLPTAQLRAALAAS